MSERRVSRRMWAVAGLTLALALIMVVPVAVDPPFNAEPVGGNVSTVSSSSPTRHLVPSDRVYQTTGDRRVALTFDDGPDPLWTPLLLRVLARYQVHATFCMIGQKAQQHPDLVRAVVRAGHTLCNHTMVHHPTIGYASRAMIRADLTAANNAITHASGGVRPVYLRAPQGRFTPTMVREGRRLQLASLGWRVTSSDWVWPPRAPRRIAKGVMRAVKPGAIVLFHDSGSPGSHAHSVEAVRLILVQLSRRGLTTGAL